ncbi:hypothetical protein SODALDRAFT_327556 [Sodiomyces alkalinus F11]|uniref:Uncharacterized protein n=1 Tax=Sodiomyces alkalinus (strain CBS 110278 / VKM F-3762 / F11) TaxID=1314773 RepID=A0A3N2Q9E3_SODAK|nr:hypothetical protein SODALDRAFT_327556 [Sodiomyces alkalinus F11]ROT43362.1 hypothetical protein SODALDRAFT_327556 [Sodiomyces alkalinus F11]
MAPLACSFRFNSPVLAMSPEAIHPSSFGMSSYEHSAMLPNTIITSTSTKPFPQPCSLSALRPNPHQTVSRKRSRDEAGSNLSSDYQGMSRNPTHRELQEDARYGEGMSRFKRNRGYIADANNQSSGWLGHITHYNTQRSVLANRSETPFIRSTKRATPTGPSSSTTHTAPAPGSLGGNMQPVVDDFTLHLGIGWRKLSEDEHIQAAARGWSRYIENHYPLSSAAILLESRGLQAYLVESAEGFFLFSEDLRQGRLVSVRADVALQNLKCSPPVFEGQDTLFATDAPEIGTAEAQGFRHGYHHGMAMEMS